MRTTNLRAWLLGAVACAAIGSASGCTGCLGYDDYHLVNGPVGGGGSGGSGAGAGGATGCDFGAPDPVVTASFAVGAWSGAGTDACGAGSQEPGVDVVAYD
ncbi:MAG TPA: hypothetical protein VHB21_06805, partial [Minicystis sp.]|nr:hypothetical protein [Minicystis sp.]